MRMPCRCVEADDVPAPAVIPPMVLLDVLTMTPTPLPRLAPLEVVPMKLPSNRLFEPWPGATTSLGNRDARGGV